mgnify:CR=1 FL=1
MFFDKRQREAAQRYADRRRREEDSPRLAIEVPRLLTLRLEMVERTGEGTSVAPPYVRHVVVGQAPALFLVSCGDAQCKDGGHDLTRDVLFRLRASETAFKGEDGCDGTIGSARCSRVLHYTGVATYAPAR